MQRRNFLQLLGIGGLATGLSVPLFGQKEVPPKIWTPDQERLTGGHLVLIRRPGTYPRITQTTRLYSRDGVQPRHGDYLSNFDGDLDRVAHSVILQDNEDPTLAFYQVARTIQEDFKNKAIQELSQIPEFIRRGLTIVTLIDNPIFLGALPEHDKQGFTVELDYDQYFVQGEVVPGDWELYSETGECPIEIPSMIDFDRILDQPPEFDKALRKVKYAWA